MAKIVNVRSKKKKDQFILDEETPAPTTEHPLDSPESMELLRKLQQFRKQARIAHRSNREQQALDCRYYDGEQWDEEDVKILTARKQKALVYNVVKNTVNWVLGTEKKSRIDWKILPRGKEDGAAAETKTKLFKFEGDVNKAQYARSDAFDHSVKAGVGWLELGVRSDPTEEPIFIRTESWRNVWLDPLSVAKDLSDARFLFREKWVDLDIAKAMFPDRAFALQTEAESSSRMFPCLPGDLDEVSDPATDEEQWDEDYDTTAIDTDFRKRVRITEMWYRVPAVVKVVKSDGPERAPHGAILRDSDPETQWLVDNGLASVFDATKMVMRIAMFCGNTLLQDAESPYRHNRFSFVPIFCYRRDRDGMAYGIIRDLRDPQDDLNKRRSKALQRLSANRVIAEKGAVDDITEAYNEVNRTDGWVTVNPGKRLDINTEAQLVSADIEMARDNERFIQSISGVTDENLGKKSNAISGKAIEARQLQGLTTSGPVFDNLYYAIQMSGEILLSLIEQFMTQEKIVRVLGESGKIEWLEINKYDQDKDEILDDISATKADFIISQQDYRETLRQAMFESLSELVQNLSQTQPEVALALLDLVIDSSDLPNKNELVARIRKINGQQDPAADQTPEEQQAQAQAEQAKQEAQQKQQALMEAMAKADLAAKEATALKAQVEAQAKRLDMFAKALEVTGTVAVTPQLAQAADGLIADAQGAIPELEMGQGQPQS